MCVPVFSDSSYVPAILADRLGDGLDQAGDRDLRIPTDSMFRLCAMDSITDPNYWISLAGRLCVDYLILTFQPGNTPDSAGIACYGLKPAPKRIYQHRFPVTGSDSLIRLNVMNIESLIRGNDTAWEKTGKIECKYPSAQNTAFWKGRQAELLGSMETALGFYEKATGSGVSHPYSLYKNAQIVTELAVKEQASGQSVQAAFYHAEEMLDAIPDSILKVEKALLRARLCIHQASWNRAEQMLHEVQRLDADQYELYMLLSRLHPSRYRAFGFRNEKELIERALDLNPADVTATLALAAVCQRPHEWSEAEAVYKRLLSLNPDHIEGLFGLGKFYLLRNQPVRMIEVYSKIYTLRPNHPEILYNLGIAYYRTDEFDKAVPFFEKAAVNYGYADAYLYMGAIRMKQGRTGEAIEAFQSRVRLRQGPDDRYADEAARQLRRLLEMQQQE
ncbi:tetratricopeptide repeat protein [bacterium]|nr:tetratricopeptide repeat protein [bacterium]